MTTKEIERVIKKIQRILKTEITEDVEYDWLTITEDVLDSLLEPIQMRLAEIRGENE